MDFQQEKQMDTVESSTAVAIPERTELVAMFKSENGLDPLLARIEAEVRSHVPDVTTKKGRDAIASLAYKVARSKTALDDAGKTLTEEQRRQINVVDASRRLMRDRLDALKDEARKPLDAWEAEEKDRVDALKARLARLRDAAPAEDTPDAFATLIARVEATAIDESWQEFTAEAAQVKDATLKRLQDAADLVRLRAEAAARAEADRLAAEAAAEAERQRLAAEAEAQRKADEELREAERAAQIEKDKAEAAQRAAKEAEDRAKAEADRQAKEAADREAALQRQLAEAKQREEAAAQAERNRIAEEARVAEEARAKRASDAAHRARIQSAIAAALESYLEMGAMGVADAIIGGAIPHVRALL
jgi:hypothetical protein